MKAVVFLLLMTLAQAPAWAADKSIPMFPKIEFTTSEGSFIVELDGRKAPVTVQNFVRYVNDGFYDGTIFHRVIPGFVAQAGGYTEDMTEKTTREPIVNESGNGISNRRGTIAMARTGHPHSATAQFYINLADNRNLDPNPRRWGYCVFGQVIEGLEVLDAIANIQTGPKGPLASNVPLKNVIIESARLLKPPPPGT
ncbi:MAG: peptidyl-prolyl cis-trans isomerase [Gammaproteobacteria bacterium]|nr:peptidyl-prolyl cis-trans isomerase [Gammaproteobacteria bacterium]NND61283.1 peptidyl-prolyl cis-trans isomerase [Gammaproteobacteria bacterium]